MVRKSSSWRVSGGVRLVGGASGVVSSGHLRLDVAAVARGLVEAAVEQEPAGALRDVPAHEEDGTPRSAPEAKHARHPSQGGSTCGSSSTRVEAAPSAVPSQ